MKFDFNKLWSKPKYFSITLALIGGIIYLLLAMQIANYSVGILDEGSYLNKGYIYASGQFKPFEDYGPQTGKMPLSFLPYGYSQLIFGNGLTTGRFTAIFLGCLMLIPMWLTTKRLSNEWWAAAAVWIIALNTTTIWNYILASSQPIVICLLAWSLYFILGKDRSELQILVGVFLGTLLVFTRINVGIVSFLIVIYVFWENGKTIGIKALAVWISVLLIGHIAYWPNILKIWAPWLPGHITPFLDKYRMSYEGVIGKGWNPTYAIHNRLDSLFFSFRSDFVAIVGWIAVILLWPKREALKEAKHKKAIIFLFITFSLLFFMHLWASLGLSYCSYCFENYMRFFDIIAILLLIAMLPLLNKQSSKVINIICALFFIVVLAGISYSAFPAIGDFAVNLPAPRIRDGKFLPGISSVGSILFNKFLLDPLAIRRVASSLFGLACAIILLVISIIIYKKSIPKKKRSSYSFAYFLIIGFVFIGTPVSLILNFKSANTEKNILEAYEIVGEHLQKHISSGSSVYWDGGSDSTPLVYLTEPTLYFPQFNSSYSFFYGGDKEELRKFGYWNDELAQQWKSEADYFIISLDRYYAWEGFFSPAKFYEFPNSPTSLTHDEGSTLLIFKRK